METWRYNTDSIISPWWNIVERRSDEHQDVFKQPDLNEFKAPGRTFGKKKDDLMHAQVSGGLSDVSETTIESWINWLRKMWRGFELKCI